jgi:hypothetical protein
MPWLGRNDYRSVSEVLGSFVSAVIVFLGNFLEFIRVDGFVNRVRSRGSARDVLYFDEGVGRSEGSSLRGVWLE